MFLFDTAGETIQFGPGVFTGGCGGVLSKNLSLDAGPYGGVTLDCDGLGRHFIISAGVHVEV